HDAQQPRMIALPLTLTDRLERPGAANVYQFAAKKGEKLTFAVEARALGFPLDPVLRVTDAAGTALGRTQGPARALGTDPPELSFSPAQDGIFRLEVRDFHGDG